MEYDPQEMFASGALLASRGIYCVRLYGVTDDFTCTCGKGAGCATPGKHPRGEGWQHLATVNEDEIAEWAFGEGASRWNLGARLGKQSGIIDVEVDGPEAQAELERWGLHLIDTPAYKASRGEHRWFAYQDDLPDVGVVKIGPLEVRIGGGGKASQSVVPHSWHGSGIQYRWLDGRSIDEVPPAEIPPQFLAAIKANARGRGGTGTVSQAVDDLVNQRTWSEGARHARLLGVASRQAARLTTYEQADKDELFAILWACNTCYCRPPKLADEIRNLANDQVDHYAQRHRARQVPHPHERFGLNYNEHDREYDPGSWHLTLVKSNPVQFKLRIPGRDQADGPTEVVLLTEDWQTPKKVGCAIQEASHWIDVFDPNHTAWSIIWNGQRVREGDGWRDQRGLRVKLFEQREEQEPDSEDNRHVSHGNILWGYLANLHILEDGVDDKPIPNGTPKWIKSKESVHELWFKWDSLIAAAWRNSSRREIEEPAKRELARRLKSAMGVGEWQKRTFRIGGKVHTFIIWTDKEVDSVGRLVNA